VSNQAFAKEKFHAFLNIERNRGNNGHRFNGLNDFGIHLSAEILPPLGLGFLAHFWKQSAMFRNPVNSFQQNLLLLIERCVSLDETK